MIACQVFWIQNIIAPFILCFCTADKLYFSKMEIRTVTDIRSPKLISLYTAENSQNDDWLLRVIALKSMICFRCPLEEKQYDLYVIEFFKFLISNILLILVFVGELRLHSYPCFLSSCFSRSSSVFILGTIKQLSFLLLRVS